ncbi:MAG: hypothetical protein E7015_01755 [Alphaproteobacteria bacterium]|nr:hypothetical protein [Alphaproteobacteria bacterium]
MNDSSEAYQIFETLLLEINAQKTLYINMMSDFALSVSKNTPIRSDHLGQELSNLKNNKIEAVCTI